MLDYDKLVLLDAETLAEQGIKSAYDELATRLCEFGIEPEPIEEILDSDAPCYAVRHRGMEYRIYGPDLADARGESWGRATHAFFTIVNRELENTDQRFYALYGGNDLGGMFLVASEADAARNDLPRETDWPYLPTSESPWYGQAH